MLQWRRPEGGGSIEPGKVCGKVREAREKAGLTQAQLAAACGVTRQTIGLIEAERYNPTVRLALLIARVVGSRLDELFWLEGPRQ